MFQNTLEHIIAENEWSLKNKELFITEKMKRFLNLRQENFEIID